MLSKVSCLRKQNDGRGQDLSEAQRANQRTTELPLMLHAYKLVNRLTGSLAKTFKRGV